MRHISKVRSTTTRVFAMAAASLFVGSCQTAPRETEGRSTYSATVHPIEGEHRQPDRVGWKIGQDSGSAAVAGSGSVVQISLAARPTGDVWLDLWRAGVRFMQLKYKNNSGSTLEYASDYKIDSVATSILQLVHPASDSASFVKKFAELLVANDAIVSKLGFPRNSIFGVDNEAVLNEAMKIMVQSGKRLDSVIPANGEWALGITAQAVHERVKELVANGVIANDTNALFPPPPVRVTTNVSMAAQIQAGGQAVGVTGSFEATSKIVRATVGVYQDTVDVSGGFDITEPDVSGRPQILNLEGKVSIVAKKATLSGTYRLEIVLEDDQGHTVRAVFAFEVLSAVDDEGPQVRIKSPVDGTGFGYEVQSVLVKADATDASGVDSVKINGNLAESREAEFVYDLALEPGKTTEILVEAWDKLGNKGVASASVSRKGPPDTSAPRLKLIGPADGTEFPIETATTTLKWLVSDLSGIPDTGVKIAGKAARRDQDTFSVVVDLPAPGEAGSYRIDATNIKGISNYETVSLKRAADKSPPRFVRLAGTTDTTVPYATTSVSLGWNVTDNVSVASVSIDGKEVARTGDTYAAAIALPRIGEFRIGMSAKDGSGNVVTDSVVVRRAYHDSIPPRFVRGAGTKDTSVPYETTSYALAWTVTDNDQVKSVTIGGEVVAGSDGNYARTVNLANGANTVVMVALDTAGNEVRDEVAIQRATDAGAPVIVRQAGTKDSTVGYTTSAIVLSWKITDDVDVASVTINGQPATGTAGIYSYALESLQVGPTGVKVTAKDAAGKTSTDSLTITRKGDAGAPVITPETGTGDKTVPYLTTTAQLGWKVVDDNGIDQVTINGAVATGANGVYTLNATGLKIGANEFTLIAKDIAGKQASHKVTITRAWKDTIDPVVVRQTGTGPVTVPYATTSVALSWKVTDTLLDSVKIQGALKTETAGGIYSATVSLPVGSTKISLLAKDKQGNVGKDEFVVVRGAPAPVHSAIGGKYIGTVYDTLTAAGADSIQYSTDGINWKRAVGGVATVKQSGTFSLIAKSWPGEATSKIDLVMRQIKSVQTTGDFSWFVMEDGSAWSAGANYSGQLGAGDREDNATATQVLTGVSDVALGGEFALILKTDGTAWGVGSTNDGGQLCGVTSGNYVTTPKLIVGGISAVEAGTGTSFFKRSSDSRWLACGSNGSGELGLGYVSETPNSYTTPIELLDVTTISAGHLYTLFHRADGSVWGSGYNGYMPMPIPDGTSPDDQVPSLRYEKAIGMATSGHSLLINPDGTASTFGGNSRLGGASGISSVIAVGAGQTISVFLLENGDIYMSGEVSPFERFLDPKKVMSGGAKISVGRETVFVVKPDGTLWGYGSNSSGAFGIGTSGAYYTTPYPINF